MTSPGQRDEQLPAHDLVPVDVGHELDHGAEQRAVVGGSLAGPAQPAAQQLPPLRAVTQLVAATLLTFSVNLCSVLTILLSLESFFR